MNTIVYTNSLNIKRKIYRYREESTAKNTAILLPPDGVSHKHFESFINKIKSDFIVYTWDALGFNELVSDIPDSAFDLEYRISEIRDITKHLNIDKYHLVTWCQSSQLALELLCSKDCPILTSTLLAPSGTGLCSCETNYTKYMQDLYYRLYDLSEEQIEGIRKYIVATMLAGQSKVFPHRYAYLSCVSSLKLYSRYTRGYVKNMKKISSLLERGNIEKPVLIMHSVDDEVSALDESNCINKLVRSMLVKYDTGGHDLLSSRLNDVVSEFKKHVYSSV